MTVASGTEQIGQGVQYAVLQRRNMRPVYPSSTQVEYHQSSSRSSQSRAGEPRGSWAERIYRSHTSSASIQDNYQKKLHHNLLGVGSQFANFGSTLRYQPSLCTSWSPENQPVHENHLHIGRNSADQQEVLGFTLNTDPIDVGKSQQQDLEQREDEARGKDNGPQ